MNASKQKDLFQRQNSYMKIDIMDETCSDLAKELKKISE